MLSLFDEPPGGGIPAPLGVVARQVYAAEPSIDSVQADLVGSTLDDSAARFCERDDAEAVAGSFGNLQERVPGDGEVRRRRPGRPAAVRKNSARALQCRLSSFLYKAILGM
jgi:hypothetical protein